MNKTTQDFLRALQKRGWQITSQKRHIKLRRGPHMLVVSSTSSDWRATLNADARARRMEGM